jgi:hypothetical protein
MVTGAEKSHLASWLLPVPADDHRYQHFERMPLRLYGCEGELGDTDHNW